MSQYLLSHPVPGMYIGSGAASCRNGFPRRSKGGRSWIHLPNRASNMGFVDHKRGCSFALLAHSKELSKAMRRSALTGRKGKRCGTKRNPTPSHLGRNNTSTGSWHGNVHQWEPGYLGTIHVYNSSHPGTARVSL